MDKKSDKIEEKSQKIEKKSEDKPTEPSKPEVKSEEKSKKSKYVKKGYNKNSAKNLGKKPKSEEKSVVLSPSTPKNSNLILYAGIVLGVIAGTSGIWYAINYFKNRKKSQKIEEKSETPEVKSEKVPELTQKEINDLKKIENASKNFEEKE